MTALVSVSNKGRHQARRPRWRGTRVEAERHLGSVTVKAAAIKTLRGIRLDVAPD